MKRIEKTTSDSEAQSLYSLLPSINDHTRSPGSDPLVSLPREDSPT